MTETKVLTPLDPLSIKELKNLPKPLGIKSGRIHVFILRALFITIDPLTKLTKIKWGWVSDMQIDPTNEKHPNSFFFRGNMYELMIDEFPLYDKQGLPIVFYDIEGRKPIKVSIDQIENQKRSSFAGKTWGKGHTLQNLIASIETKGGGNIFMYIVMLIVGILGGILLDHFLHI